MHYSINLSEESDHLLRQLCDPGPNSPSEAVPVEDFLSAIVEEHLDELFVRRERRKTEKDKKLDGAVRSAKERAKAWSDAAIATQTALEAMRKLVTDGATNPKADRGEGNSNRLRQKTFGHKSAYGRVTRLAEERPLQGLSSLYFWVRLVW